MCLGVEKVLFLDVHKPKRKLTYVWEFYFCQGKKKTDLRWLNYSICPDKTVIQTYTCQTPKQELPSWWSLVALTSLFYSKSSLY